MKKILSVVLLLLSIQINLIAQNNPHQLIITPLTHNFYVFTTYNSFKGKIYPANSMYMLTRKGAVIFDTPWDSTHFKPLLDSIKIKHRQEVIMCIATHFHEDRTGGLDYYKKLGIKTYTTKQTDELSEKHHEKRAEFLIEKDTVFNIGNQRFQTYYPGQGHAPDNIVIWFDKEKILYGGCFIKSTNATDLGNLSDANVQEWALSLKKVEQKFKKPEFIITGHDDWKNTASIQHTLKLIEAHHKKNK